MYCTYHMPSWYFEWLDAPVMVLYTTLLGISLAISKRYTLIKYINCDFICAINDHLIASKIAFYLFLTIPTIKSSES